MIGSKICASTLLVSLVMVTTRAQVVLLEDNKCILLHSNEYGICTDKCLPALEQYIVHGILPETCGQNGTEPIFCCSTNQQVTTTPKIYTKSGKGKSYDKCTEYADQLIVRKKSPLVGEGYYNESTCVFEAVPLVVGGKKADPKEFPHMALIGYDDGDSKVWVCGGSLISDKFVLTAAHCLFSSTYGDAKYVRLGDLNKQIDLPGQEDPREFNVKNTHMPAEYDGPEVYHDIGLIELDKVVVFNAFIRPACMFSRPTIPGDGAVATGWGSTMFLGASSDDLLKVTLKFVDFQKCNSSYKSYISNEILRTGIMKDSQICAGGDKKDTCQGDSGGPLQILTSREEFYCMYWIVGVTAFGKACGTGGDIGVYTRVSHYLPWIENIVWA